MWRDSTFANHDLMIDSFFLAKLLFSVSVTSWKMEDLSEFSIPFWVCSSVACTDFPKIARIRKNIKAVIAAVTMEPSLLFFFM